MRGRSRDPPVEDRGEPEAGDRRLHEEDRPPVEELGEDSSQSGSDGYADRPRPGPDGGASMHGAGQRTQDRKGTGEEERCAEPLDAAKGEQRLQVPGKPAADRGAEEEREAAGRLEAREAARDRDQRQRGDRDHQVVGRDHPRDADDRGAEVRVQLRQREDDDRRVRERDGDRRREGDSRGEGQPTGHSV